jgi:hypothetical protein
MKFLDLLYLFDFYAIPISLYKEKRFRYKTVFGAITAIITLILSILPIYFEMEEVILKNKPLISYYIRDSVDPLGMTNKIMPFFEINCFNNYTLQPAELVKYFYISIGLNTYTPNDILYQSLNLRNCTVTEKDYYNNLYNYSISDEYNLCIEGIDDYKT